MEYKKELFQYFKKQISGMVLVEEPLSNHTTFRIGGPADIYVFPKNLDDLYNVIDFCENEEVSRFIIGNGTNLLINDQGYRGVVIDLSKTLTEIHGQGNVVHVGAGLPLDSLIQFCTERGLSGLENLIGIPGQVGGAICLNAGAFGSEVTDHLESIQILDKFSTLETLNRKELQTGYRYINIPQEDLIIGAKFILGDGNPKIMAAVQDKVLRKRRLTQPLSLPSAGSVFKRPPGDYAGRLIEESGCKGLRIGDALVSKKHANFIVNCHLASAQDVLRLIEEVKNRVLQRFGVELELEIHIIGFDSI